MMSLNRQRLASRVLMILLIAASAYHCSTSRKTASEESPEVITTNVGAMGLDITLEFTRGEAHNHPLMAIWIEDTLGNYLETLYLAESIGKGVFRHGDRSKGQWREGPIRRPAALPYWGHQRGVQAPDGYYLPTPEDPMPDAVTGATPQGNFILKSTTSQLISSPFVILLEVNQSWDWNGYWTNSKYPEDEQYKTSSQPSVIYSALIDPGAEKTEYVMEAVGHGHYSGRDGRLYTDLSTLTTALKIVQSARVKISPSNQN